jgi:hypothetical protein
MWITHTLSTSAKCGKMCKLQQASHLAFNVCKVSCISNQLYANNSLKIDSVHVLNWMGQCEHKSCLYMNIELIFHFYKNKHHWCSCKVIGVNTFTYWAPTRRKHKHFPLWPFFFQHSNHLQIAWLMCQWVDICVGFMFIYCDYGWMS